MTQPPDNQGTLRVTVPWEVLQSHTIPVGTVITILAINLDATGSATHANRDYALVSWMDNTAEPLECVVAMADLESHTEAA